MEVKNTNYTNIDAALDAITRFVRTPSVAQQYSIGIAITTHNRPVQFIKTYTEIQRHLPEGARLIVVDDASTIPVTQANYRFARNAGIAAAKNKCIELLQGCEHVFLFDDDTYPVKPDWWRPYVESDEPHLMYIFKDLHGGKMTLGDTSEIYRDDKIVAYTHPRGCMCYFKKVCFDKVGGMYTGFGRWGYEHPDLSNRIYNKGLTSFQFMDVPGSADLFYSGDEYQTVKTTVSGTERANLITRNAGIYAARKSSSVYEPYTSPADKENVILTCFFNGQPDPQRGGRFKPDVAQMQSLIDSVTALNLKLIVLTDCLDEPDTENVRYLKVMASTNPYFQRWFSYYQYLIRNTGRLKYVFCVDATDIEVLHNPFEGIHESAGRVVYTGDENERLANDWMLKHHPHPELKKFMQDNANTQLLNAGILGGDVDSITTFIRIFTVTYQNMIHDSHVKRMPGPGITDMGLFNYVARKYFNVINGAMVNTRFKADERNNFSWFKHK